MDTTPDEQVLPPPPPAWPVTQQSEIGLPDAAPAPPPIPPRTKPRGPLIAATVLCLVIAAVLGTTAATRFRSDRSPGSVVRAYFAAIAKGNAPSALAYASQPAIGDYLTRDVLKAQLAVAPLSRVSIQRTSIDGDRATVAVDYRLNFSAGAQQVEDSVALVRAGSSWRLSQAAVVVQLSHSAAGSDELRFAGRPLPTGRILVFPGALPLASNTSAFRASGRLSARLADAATTREISVSVSDASRAVLEKSLTAAFARCLSGTPTNPNCPLPEQVRSIPSSLRGKEQPNAAASDVALLPESGGRIDVTATKYVQGTWKIWDFNNQTVAKQGLIGVALHATVSVADLSTVYWVRP